MKGLSRPKGIDIKETKVVFENGVTGTRLNVETDDQTYPVRHHDDMKWYWHLEGNGQPFSAKVHKGYTVVGEWEDDE